MMVSTDGTLLFYVISIPDNRSYNCLNLFTKCFYIKLLQVLRVSAFTAVEY